MLSLHHPLRGHGSGSNPLCLPARARCRGVVCRPALLAGASAAAARRQPIAPSKLPRRQRPSEPKPFAGLTRQPPWALCAPAAVEPAPAPAVRPEPLPPSHRRPRTVDPSTPFWPHTACADRGWLGLGHLRANGHPHGGPGRQVHGLGCNGSLPEHHGTVCQGNRGAVALLVRVLACLAAGWGRRAPAECGRPLIPRASTVGHRDLVPAPWRWPNAGCLRWSRSWHRPVDLYV
jgi:hypothetical protein